MKKILLCVFILLLSVNVFASDVDIEQLTEAAKNGDVEAQNFLAFRYLKGFGVDQDYKQSVYWYQKAAEQGHAVAQTYLGYCYYDGLGVTIDPQQAVFWFQKAVEQGNFEAQHLLGICYASGFGVLQDNKLAYMWTSVSLSQATDAMDIETIKISLAIITANMTGLEIAEAEQMAAEWMERHR